MWAVHFQSSADTALLGLGRLLQIVRNVNISFSFQVPIIHMHTGIYVFVCKFSAMDANSSQIHLIFVDIVAVIWIFFVGK